MDDITPQESPAIDPVADPAFQAALDAALARDGAAGYWDPDPRAHAQYGYPLSVEQGRLLYILARATAATRVVEFATSIGISTLFLAAAVRDNATGTGRPGIVIGSEIVPEKVAIARANLEAAGLSQHADVREGDAFETLRELGGPVDLLLLDGWPTGQLPSIDRRILDVVVPQMRVGSLLLDDNGEPDVIAYLRDPANGFRSTALPFVRASSELAVKVR